MKAPRKPWGIFGCGSNISCCVTPTRRVWRACPCAPAGFCSHNKQTVSGQNRGLKRFLSAPEACYVAVVVTVFLVPGFTSFSIEFVFSFCFSTQLISSDAEDFLVSLKPSRGLNYNCTSPEPWGKPAAQSGSTWHSLFLGAKNKQVYSYRPEAFLNTVEEERCPKPKFYEVPHRWHWNREDIMPNPWDCCQSRWHSLLLHQCPSSGSPCTAGSSLPSQSLRETLSISKAHGARSGAALVSQESSPPSCRAVLSFVWKHGAFRHGGIRVLKSQSQCWHHIYRI